MKENSIEKKLENIQNVNLITLLRQFKKEGVQNFIVLRRSNFDEILSDYKRVLKENEIYKKNSEIMSKENLSTAEQLKVEIKENFRLKNQLENNRKEYQETYKDVREELKELKKENEELRNGTRRNEDELEVSIDGDWDALKKALDEAEKTNEYIIYDNGKWIKEKYCVPIQKVKDKIEDLYKEDRKWTEELSEPDSNFKNIDRNLKRIKNQIESLQELIEEKGKE